MTCLPVTEETADRQTGKTEFEFVSKRAVRISRDGIAKYGTYWFQNLNIYSSLSLSEPVLDRHCHIQIFGKPSEILELLLQASDHLSQNQNSILYVPRSGLKEGVRL